MLMPPPKLMPTDYTAEVAGNEKRHKKMPATKTTDAKADAGKQSHVPKLTPANEVM